MTAIDYSDTTPDIGFSYNRLGNKTTVSDASGTRTFTYNTHLQPQSETVTGLIHRTITRTYASDTGKHTGFTIDDGYNVSYGYDNTGRFNRISWSAAGKTDTAVYAYETNSHLIKSLTYQTGTSTVYTYDPYRDLKTQVKNQHPGTTFPNTIIVTATQTNVLQ